MKNWLCGMINLKAVNEGNTNKKSVFTLIKMKSRCELITHTCFYSIIFFSQFFTFKLSSFIKKLVKERLYNMNYTHKHLNQRPLLHHLLVIPH